MTVLAELAARGRAAPDPALDALVGDHVLDALACLASGAGAPLAARLAGLAAPGSVLLRGALVHVDEFDALHGPAAVAPSAVVVPVAWELAPDGRTLADAVVAGTEVVVEAALRFGGAELYRAGWWPTALFGGLGAAAAAAVCLGLDEATTVQALGLAAAPLGGLFSADEFADSHYLLPGQAAERGLWAVRAAAAGCTTSTTLLDEPAGAALRPAGPPTPAGPHLPDVALKAWPCARPLHAALAALDELAAAGVVPADGDVVEVGLPAAALRFVSADPAPATPAAAAASAAAAIAGFVRGRATDPAWYRAPAPGPEVRLHALPALDALFPRYWAAEVAVRGERRRVLTALAPSAGDRRVKASRLLGLDPGDALLDRLCSVAGEGDLTGLRVAVDRLLP
ncbi:MmgE/PrpD family protein [Blastococcus sp. SYSU D00669]